MMGAPAHTILEMVLRLGSRVHVRLVAASAGQPAIIVVVRE